MVKLIGENLGQIPETKAIHKLLKDARAPGNKRNDLVHGTWWRVEGRTATITVRRGSQRKNKDRFAEYTEECILEIADPFKDIAVDLYKLRRDIENRY
jgi:predicted oxidoreductase